MSHKLTSSLILLATIAIFSLAATPGSVAQDTPPVDEKNASADLAPNQEPHMPPRAGSPRPSASSPAQKKKDFPPFSKISDGFTKVISTADGARSLYTIWTRKKDSQMLAELPASFERQLLFIAYTVAGGTTEAGVQTGDRYAKWKRFDKRLALIEPNFGVRTTGDLESKKGHDRVFTDRVILDVPILTMGPSGGPVIDMDALLLGQAGKFFGYAAMGANPRLAKIAKAKAFPKNVELAYELPLAGGQFGTLHYSISVLPQNTGYKPRVADTRVGFFTTSFMDVGHPDKDTPWVRYITRWNLQKADPKLKHSPPKQPIVFYLEHTIPVRYRRWVRAALLEWNKAFAQVGIDDAIEVYQQDARSGAHMEKDPEDARYNFILWTNSNMGFAIGPSRVDPRTGQILDADIVMDEGFVTSWVNTWNDLIPETAMANFDPLTLAWLADKPQWDPRVRLAPPAQRNTIIRKLARQRMQGTDQLGQNTDPTLMGDDRYDGLSGRLSQMNGRCDVARTTSYDLALFRLDPSLLRDLAARKTSYASPSDDNNGKSKDPVTGTWEGSVETPQGEMQFTLELELHDDNSVTGSIEQMGFEAELTGEFDRDSMRLLLDMEIPGGPVVKLDLTIEGDSLSGTADAEGESIAISATRISTGDDEEEQTDYTTSDSDEELEPQPEEEANGVDTDDEIVEEAEEPEPVVLPEGEQMLDGVPESFIGPLLKDVIMHEVGHTLGLRHNFKASTIYDLAEINSPELKGQAITGSVMDYNPTNINFDDGPVQGEYTMVTIGPYDLWAIEYGYTLERNLKPILKRVSEPGLAYGTDEDSFASDPATRTFDMGKDPLDFCESQARLVHHLREKILDRMVKKGDSWSKARRGYELLLGRQFGAVSVAANWIGGAHNNRDHKGDPGDRNPVTPVSVEQQRHALKFVIENTFRDDAWGLTPELLAKMNLDKWWDDGGMRSIFDDPAWPVHQRILGLQSSALSMVMNPSTLGGIFDNEFRIAADEDALTLPEVINGLSDEIWSELQNSKSRTYTARQPLISSLRRNLQRELLERLIDLSLPNPGFGVAAKPVANLCTYKLRDLKNDIDSLIEKRQERLDPYSLAHLAEASLRIEKALDAQYLYNTDALGGGGMSQIMFFGEK